MFVMLPAGIWFLHTPQIASISVIAETGFVAAEDESRQAVDFRLPRGALRILATLDGPAESVATLPADSWLIRVTQGYRLTARRSPGDSLHVTIGSLDPTQPLKLTMFSSRKGQVDRNTVSAMQVAYNFDASYSGADADPILPLRGNIVVGEHLQTDYGALSSSMPIAAHVLRSGKVTVRTQRWLDNDYTVDALVRDLQLGDVVSAARTQEAELRLRAEHEVPPPAAVGFVRLGENGNLSVVFNAYQKYVTVVRGSEFRIGASKADAWIAQPIFSAIWQMCAALLVVVAAIVTILLGIRDFRIKKDIESPAAAAGLCHSDAKPDPSRVLKT
jgi:hypothetical protein